MEVYEGIHRISVPMPGPLRNVNVYLVRGRQGHLLVDAGWNSPEGWQTLWTGLEQAGVRIAPGCIERLLITHVHPDHIGMAGRVKESFGAEVLMHAYEQVVVGPRYVEPRVLMEHMTQWLKTNGVPEGHLANLRDVSLALTGRTLPKPDTPLLGGEEIQAGPYRWQVLWTPGHSPGHVCLYEPAHQILISGDYVLPHQTPNISLHPQSTPNPLADYLDSLEQTRRLPVRLVLPAHGDPFADLRGRVEHTVAHHQRRLAELRTALQAGPHSAWEAAHAVAWSGGRRRFADFDQWNQRLALLETLAHLECLRLSDGVRKTFESGVARYYLADC